MFTLAIKWGQASENPVKQVKYFPVNSQRLRFLSIDEERRLMAVCDSRIKPIVLTALKTGMRKGEILGLMWEQVDFENRMITVKDSKNREPRKIPMNPGLTELLQSIRIGSQGAHVFNNEHGRIYNTIRGPWGKALKKAGIIDFRFHDLRHTFASRLVMAGVDLVTVKELLGHKSINMTMRYSHLSQDHKRKAVELLDRHYMDTKQEIEKKTVAVSNYKQ
jgi:integrase